MADAASTRLQQSAAGQLMELAELCRSDAAQARLRRYIQFECPPDKLIRFLERMAAHQGVSQQMAAAGELVGLSLAQLARVIRARGGKDAVDTADVIDAEWADAPPVSIKHTDATGNDFSEKGPISHNSDEKDNPLDELGL